MRPATITMEWKDLNIGGRKYCMAHLQPFELSYEVAEQQLNVKFELDSTASLTTKVMVSPSDTEEKPDISVRIATIAAARSRITFTSVFSKASPCLST